MYLFERIVKENSHSLVSLRLRKFSVGYLNPTTKHCENAWIEITEIDHYDEAQKETAQLKHNEQNPNLNLTAGKFCGTLNNFWSTFYSEKHLTIGYYYELSSNRSANKKSPNIFEFEVSFYDRKHVLNKNAKHIKFKSNMTTQFSDGTRLKQTTCDRVFNECNRFDGGCRISSPGYPGIYLKDKRCLFHLHNQKSTNNTLNQKLILINDNIQLDGNICHYAQTPSFFCDNGTRSSSNCKDYLNIYNGNELAEVKLLCGMGRIAKFVTKKASLSLEFVSGREGYFANTGFLFYALNQKQYQKNFADVRPTPDTSQPELESLIKIDQLQTELCNSDVNDCDIQIGDDTLTQIYAATTLRNHKFQVGYLYGFNQIHRSRFQLKYLLHTKRFNTIAIYLNSYKPSKSAESHSCNQHLSIETTSQLISNYQDYYEDYDYEKTLRNQSDKHKQSILFKVCNPNELSNHTVRLFLVKTTEAKLKPKTNLAVTYFSSNETLFSEMNDFKISYEFLDFDWKHHQANSICNFVYDSNDMDSKSGQQGWIRNPQASIFYQTHANDSVQALSCNYRFIARPNQYVRLTVESVDFHVSHCENVYFFNKSRLVADTQRCDNLKKKLKIKELDFVDSSLEQYFMEDLMETKVCICKSTKHQQVYISKFNTVEVEYLIQLDNNLNANNFVLRYEFVDRECDKLMIPNLKTQQKGKIILTNENSLGQNLGVDYPSVEVREEDLDAKQLQLVLKNNLNFYCKFYIKPPRQNQFVYIELVEFVIGKSCDNNFIKLYSNYSETNASVSDSAAASPFISLCNLNQVTTNRTQRDQVKAVHKSSMITAYFAKEAHVRPTLTCYKTKNKVCFMTNELENELNPFSRPRSKPHTFYNDLVVEILATDLREFYYEIRYHFFEIEQASQSKLSTATQSETIGLDFVLKSMNSQKCSFKCPAGPNASSSLTEICLDEVLICDNEVDCIYNNADELNCKF